VPVVAAGHFLFRSKVAVYESWEQNNPKNADWHSLHTGSELCVGHIRVGPGFNFNHETGYLKEIEFSHRASAVFIHSFHWDEFGTSQENLGEEFRQEISQEIVSRARAAENRRPARTGYSGSSGPRALPEG